jgi:transposase
MRFIGLDVHRDFCEVAIAEGGVVRLAGRADRAGEVGAVAQSLGGGDEVALEATGNALGIARIIEPHVGRVVLANPKAVKGITRAGAKTDKIDARTLAKLLAGGFLPAVWLPDEQTRILRRRISARAQLVRQRTRAKNQVHATLIRNLKGKPPVSDLFGARGRRWLAAQVLPPDERETVAGCLRQIEFLDGEIALVERTLAEQVLASPEMRRLLTLPGVNFVTAAAVVAAIGDIGRFPTARRLVSYLGLDPRVHQSGVEPARHGRISKQGPGETRHVLVEAAWHATRTPGPLRAFHERIAARRGGNVATVAVARKLAVIAWHMLSRGEDYAFARPSLTREKVRRLELMTGAEHQKGKRIGVFATKEQHRLDKELAAQAELAYRRLVQDWQPYPRSRRRRQVATGEFASQANAMRGGVALTKPRSPAPSRSTSPPAYLSSRGTTSPDS